MTEREFFSATVRDELPRFERVLGTVAQLTEKDLAYRPHPKSYSAWELVTRTFGGEGIMFSVFLDSGRLDFSTIKPAAYTSVAEVVAAFKKNMAELEKKAAAMTESDWASKAVMANGKDVVWETTKGNMAWGLLFDLIHHRGQFSTYLRPLGCKVPSIYGPSGDSA